ncbi:hypothetical protein HDU76_009823, partial [Blyttiomyces sp. JEL0837]
DTFHLVSYYRKNADPSTQPRYLRPSRDPNFCHIQIPDDLINQPGFRRRLRRVPISSSINLPISTNTYQDQDQTTLTSVPSDKASNSSIGTPPTHNGDSDQETTVLDNDVDDDQDDDGDSEWEGSPSASSREQGRSKNMKSGNRGRVAGHRGGRREYYKASKTTSARWRRDFSDDFGGVRAAGGSGESIATRLIRRDVDDMMRVGMRDGVGGELAPSAFSHLGGDNANNNNNHNDTVPADCPNSLDTSPRVRMDIAALLAGDGQVYQRQDPGFVYQYGSDSMYNLDTTNGTASDSLFQGYGTQLTQSVEDNQYPTLTEWTNHGPHDRIIEGLSTDDLSSDICIDELGPVTYQSVISDATRRASSSSSVPITVDDVMSVCDGMGTEEFGGEHVLDNTSGTLQQCISYAYTPYQHSYDRNVTSNTLGLGINFNHNIDNSNMASMSGLPFINEQGQAISMSLLQHAESTVNATPTVNQEWSRLPDAWLPTPSLGGLQ